MSRQKAGARLLGPYEHSGRFRFIACAADGSRTPSETYATKGLCEKGMTRAQAVLDGKRTVILGDARDEYEIFMRTIEGNTAESVYLAMHHIGLMFPGQNDELLEGLVTGEKFKAAYESLYTRATQRSREACARAALARLTAGEQEPKGWASHPIGARECLCARYAADSHMNALAETKTFLRRCQSNGYITEAQMEACDKVDSVGRRKHGKRQPTVNELRKFLEVAFTEAMKPGIEGERALAPIIAVVMGLRASEILGLLVRHVDDDDGRRLIIEDGKSDESNAGEGENPGLKVPEELRPFLLRLKKGKLDGASLWMPDKRSGAAHRRDWVRDSVARLCNMAGVRVVTAHGLRAMFATMAVEGGWDELREKVRKDMRHRKWSTTAQSYAKRGSVRQARQDAALSMLRGGRA